MTYSWRRGIKPPLLILADDLALMISPGRLTFDHTSPVCFPQFHFMQITHRAGFICSSEKHDMCSVLSVCSKSNTEGASFRVFTVREWDFGAEVQRPTESPELLWKSRKCPQVGSPGLTCLCAFSGNRTSQTDFSFLIHKQYQPSKSYCPISWWTFIFFLSF